MSNQFDWIPIYKEMAEKLRPYFDRRQELVEKINLVFENSGVKMPKLEKDNKLIDIDPFTVFGLFNKGLSDTNRNALLSEMTRLFDLHSPLPTAYEGIPVLNSLNATFYRFYDERDENDIDDLWKLFEFALRYAGDSSDSNRTFFSESFDVVIKTKYNGNAKITMALYWIAPETYLNLDSRNRWYIFDTDRLPTDFVNALPKVRDRIMAAQYLKMIEQFNRAFTDPGFPFHDYISLSYEAWRYSEQVNQENKIKKTTAQMNEKGDGLADSDVRTTHYWLYSPGVGAEKWEEFYQAGIMSVDWESPIGDLSAYQTREEIRKKLQEHYGLDRSYKNDSLALWQFANVIQPGDIVYAKKGMRRLVGRGIVKSEYEYSDSVGDYHNIREVNWTHNGDWLYPGQAAMKVLTDISQLTDLVAELEAIFSVEEDETPSAALEEETVQKYPPYNEDQFLEDVYIDRAAYETLVGLIRKKKNVILQGAPGVGKTYAAKRLAYSMMGEKNQDRVQMVQFHQSYSYEDFIEGFRPTGSGNGFEIKKGSFYHFCRKAADDLDNEYFFIIDEINRGNLSRIFGELFMLIESDKRGNELQLLYSDEKFSVPKNVYILGMMNTADRSLAMLDYALRRRFAFYDMKPAFESAGFREYRMGLNSDPFNRLVDCVEKLNNAIKEDESLGEGFCIGHSYFCDLKEVSSQNLSGILEYELSPLLMEYWYDDRVKANDWISRLKDAIK